MITLNQSYTYEELLRNLQESGAQYPDFTVYKEVGESHDERSIPMLRVGLGLDALILTAGIHGKESINPVLLTRMAQEYRTGPTGNTTQERSISTGIFHANPTFSSSSASIPPVNRKPRH